MSWVEVDEAGWRRVHDLAIPILYYSFEKKRQVKSSWLVRCVLFALELYFLFFILKGILINKVPLITNTCPY